MEKSGGDHSDETRPSTSVSKMTCLSSKDGPVKDATKENNQEEQMNPLNIAEVVAVVVGHLNDVGDLKNVRTQSTVWRDESLKKWRDSAVLVITVETFPILVKAFEEADLAHFAAGGNDPFKLKKVPFKKYRFAGNRRGQLWTYPLSKADIEGRLLWDKVITPHATLLDVGECALKKFTGGGLAVTYQPALRWIMKRCPNVTDLAMAPIKSWEIVEALSDSEEETEELIKGHDYLFMPGGPLWKLKRFNAPQVKTFTVSTPQQTWWSMSRTGSKKLTGLFETESVITREPSFGDFLLGGMMNLKHLQLPTGGGASSLFMGVTPFGTEKNVHLESLTAFASEMNNCLNEKMLWNYLETVCPPLRELRASFYYRRVYQNDPIQIRLNTVQTTLEKLELEITISTVAESVAPSSEGIPEVKFSLGNGSLKKFTHFKITVDCCTTPRLLGTFDLNRLMEFSAVEEFYFGIMNRVDKAWLTRKLQFFDGWSIHSAKLDNLKSFHFYGNLTKETLDKLEKMAGSLETLEVVLDEENCSVVQDNWPHLKNLKLLQGSNVSDEFLSALKSKRSLLRLEKW